MGRATEAARACARALHRVVPKLDHAVIWGWPDHEDSVLALEAALQHTRVRRVFVLMTDRRAASSTPTGSKTVRLRKDTPLGWAVFLFARYVFFTHRCFVRAFPPDVVSVNVWHGMPIKRIGWLLEGDQGIASRHVLATSPFWADIMDRAMGPAGGALATGLPRNDRLFLEPAPVLDALRRRTGTDAERLVMWLPTFRRSVRGYLTVDGTPTDSPFEFDVDVEALNAVLARHRTLLLVKPHPMAAFAGPRSWSNVAVVDDAWLRAEGLSLYQALGAASVLVSDVSSVTIDYLLLDRPVIHAMADLEAYQDTRGFTVDRIDDLLAGPVATSSADLVSLLDGVLGGADPGADQRRRVRDLSHATPDAGATARLLRAIGLLDKGSRAPLANSTVMTRSEDDHLGA